MMNHNSFLYTRYHAAHGNGNAVSNGPNGIDSHRALFGDLNRWHDWGLLFLSIHYLADNVKSALPYVGDGQVNKLQLIEALQDETGMTKE